MTRSTLFFLLGLLVASPLCAARAPGWSFNANTWYSVGQPVGSLLNSFDEHRGGVIPKRHHLSFGLGGAHKVTNIHVRDGSRIKLRQTSVAPALRYSFNLDRWQFGVGAVVPAVVISSPFEQLNKVESGIIDNVIIRYTVPGKRKFTVAFTGSLAGSFAELSTYAQWPVLSQASHQLFYDMGWGVRTSLLQANLLVSSLVTAHGLRYQYGMFGAQLVYDASFGVARSMLDRANAGVVSHTVSAGVSATWKGLTARIHANYAIAQSWLLRASSPFGVNVGLQYAF